MPKSKRARVVHLSKVEKKGKELSIRLFAAVRKAAEIYQYCYVFSVENMRNTYLKDIRSHFADSRLFFGKTKVMAKAIGQSAEESYLPNLYLLQPHLTGSIGLMFTAHPPATILSYFVAYSHTDFARAGTSATRDFTVPEGILYSRAGEIPLEEDVAVAHSLEPTLRKWGLPTSLVRGKILLNGPHQVCREGQILDSNQTALLKMFGITMSEFKVQIKAFYDSTSQIVQEVDVDNILQE